MSVQIRLSVGELRDLAARFRSQAAELERCNAGYTALVGDLRAQWEGDAADFFFLLSDEMRPRLGVSPQILQGLAGNLDRIADEFEEAERRAKLAFLQAAPGAGAP